MINLRNCEDNDINDLYEAYNDSYSEVKYAPKFESISRFRNMLNNERIFLTRSLLAYDDEGTGKIAGFIFVSAGKGAAHISLFGVIKEYRQKGIAKRLLNRLVRDVVELEEVKKVFVEIYENEDYIFNIFEEYGFEERRTLDTLYRNCPETEIPNSVFSVATEFPSELLKNYNIYHQVRQPWFRLKSSIRQYNTVVGYGVSHQSRICGYALIGFDNTILDLASRSYPDNSTDHMSALLTHVFAKFDDLITVDLPQDDELFEVYGKLGFQTVYRKKEMVLQLQKI